MLYFRWRNKMRLRSTHFGAVFILLVCFTASAQQVVNESKIVQMRATIQKLEDLSADANIPVETRQHLSELLFEKRGELHALLRQKRDALRTNLQGTTAPDPMISETIQDLNREMLQLSGTSTATSIPAASVPPPSVRAGSDAGNNGAATTVEETVRTPEPASSAPVTDISSSLTSSATPASGVPAVAPPAAVQPAPMLAQPAAGSQDPCTVLLNAPAPSVVDYRREIQAVACRMSMARGRGLTTGEAEMDFRNYSVAIALGLVGTKIEDIVIPEMTAQAENASHAKNLSSTENSSGGTSLVAKAGLPAVFGFAVENGALTRAIDGTTVTFTGNPVGLVEAMAKKGFIDSFQTQDDFTAFLRKLSFGVSFDTSRGDQSGVFTGDRQQLSGFSFKFNILDQRDPRHPKYTNRWLKITRQQASKLALSLNNFVRSLATAPGVPAFNAWRDETNRALNGKTRFEEIEPILIAQLRKLAEMKIPEVEAQVKAVASDLEDFVEERNNILDEISNGWIATFDYNNERPVTGPSLSNFRFLAEKGAYNGSIDFTGNASMTIYNSRPTIPNTQRLRDFRFAGQIDVPIGDVAKTGKFMLSFAGRYERLLNDEPIAGTTAVIKKGDIAVGQLKLTIPLRGTALKFPLSITFANRTELIQEKEVRGNFGVTFDLDSILAKFNPFSRP
jgi:hypothetical protein